MTDRADPIRAALRSTRTPMPGNVDPARSALFDDAGAFSDYLCAQVGEARLLVRTEDKHIGRAVFVKGGRGDVDVLRRCVMIVEGLLGEGAIAGSTLIDVGANIGTTTIPALLTLPFANAVALEPEAENFVNLRLNLLLNAVEDQTTAIQAAASNRVGELDLVVNRTRSGKHWIAIDEKRLRAAKQSETPTKVPVVTLDALAQEAFDPEMVGLLWIDAESHEGHILEGASDLLRRGVPLVFEWDRAGLEKRGDRRKIHEVIAEHYTHFADMRASTDPRRPKYELRAADTLDDYAHVSTEGEEHFTEILALRLRSNPARGHDLTHILKGSEPRHTRRPTWPRVRKAGRDPTRPEAAGTIEVDALRQQLTKVASSAGAATARLARLQDRIAGLEAQQVAPTGTPRVQGLEAVHAATKLERLRQQAADVTVRVERLGERRKDIEHRLAVLGVRERGSR